VPQPEPDGIVMVVVLKNDTKMYFMIPKDGKFLVDLYRSIRESQFVLVDGAVILNRDEIITICPEDMLRKQSSYSGRIPVLYDKRVASASA